MSIKVKGMIEYYGLADEMPTLDTQSSFQHFCLNESIPLSKINPDILKIVKIVSGLNLSDNRVVRTPKATSVEGQRLTGYKLVIDGTLDLKVEYINESIEQLVHSIHFSMPFCTYVVLPADFKPGINTSVKGYIEDISSGIYNNNILYINALLLLIAEF